MDAEVFVFDHDPGGLFELIGHEQRLARLEHRRFQARDQIPLLTVGRDGQALRRANVQARVAFDAQRIKEHRLNIAVQTTLYFLRGLLGIEPQFDLFAQLREPFFQRDATASPLIWGHPTNGEACRYLHILYSLFNCLYLLVLSRL